MIKCFNAARTFMSVSPFHLWLCPLHLKSSSSQGCKMNAIRFQKTILAGSDPEGEGAPLASAIQQTSFALLWLEQLRSYPLLIPMTKEILWEIWSWATHLSLEHSWGQGDIFVKGWFYWLRLMGIPLKLEWESSYLDSKATPCCRAVEQNLARWTQWAMLC